MGNCCSPGCRLWCLWWCLFVLFFFTRGVLDVILNLIESVSEGFPSYFWIEIYSRIRFYIRVNLISNTYPRKKIRKIEVWKKQDETGHFSNGIQCAAMAPFKTLQKLSFLLTYTTQLMRRLNGLVRVATDLRQPHVLLIAWISHLWEFSRSWWRILTRSNVIEYVLIAVFYVTSSSGIC